MSIERGRSLPEHVCDLVRPSVPAHLVIPCISVDDRGLPHPALLSLYEIVLWRQDLYFFISQTSRSAGYLGRRRVVTLIFLDPVSALYLKGYARAVGRRLNQAVFRLEIHSVLEDFSSQEEGPAHLVCGTCFEADEELIEKRIQTRREMLKWLIEG